MEIIANKLLPFFARLHQIHGLLNEKISTYGNHSG